MRHVRRLAGAGVRGNLGSREDAEKSVRAEAEIVPPQSSLPNTADADSVRQRRANPLRANKPSSIALVSCEMPIAPILSLARIPAARAHRPALPISDPDPRDHRAFR
jgi:hypothetical protein